MSGAELLPEWSSAKEIEAVLKGVVGTGCKSARCSAFRAAVKDYTSWHSRISTVIFFCVLLGTGGILGVIATLNAVGYLGNPESGFLSTGFTFLPSRHPFHQEVPSDIVLEPHRVDLTNLSDVYHDMSEAELLWRASVEENRRPRSDSGITPKVAFMFLTRGPLPLRPLWERYFKGHGDLYSIYIHAHPNYMPHFPDDSVFHRRNIPSKEVYWGKLSMFAAERRLLANALLDSANERFVLLSESCIPITPFPVAYKYFTESQHSFVGAFYLAGKGGTDRYYRIKDERKLMPEIMPKQWRKGSQWFEMSRALALMVVYDRKYYPKFDSLLCKGDCTCYVDEHYLSTVLTILAPEQIANRTSTYFDFSQRTPHPKQWGKRFINEGLLKNITAGHNCTYNGKLTETCHMFARKFSPDAVNPLLELAASVFGIP